MTLSIGTHKQCVCLPMHGWMILEADVCVTFYASRLRLLLKAKEIMDPLCDF